MTPSELIEESGLLRAASPWSASAWIGYFKKNACVLPPLPWGLGATLTQAERAALLPSLQEFQQGEGQDGGHFFRCVRAYGASTGDLAYVEAHELFMAEEQRHARDLAEFLRCEGMPLLAECSLRSRLFCWCGSRGGLELTLTIILFAEVVAQVYYRAVHESTPSPLLRRLCVQILRDEHMHVRFHCERLALLRRRWSPWSLTLTHALDALLFCGAVLVCWWGHAPALRAGGHGFRRFWREARARFRRACRLKRPLPPSASSSPPLAPRP